jgi:hypothetical protein
MRTERPFSAEDESAAASLPATGSVWGDFAWLTLIVVQIRETLFVSFYKFLRTATPSLPLYNRFNVVGVRLLSLGVPITKTMIGYASGGMHPLASKRHRSCGRPPAAASS